MNHIVFKCKACDMGPCLHQCDKSLIRDPSGYGDDDVIKPTLCPYGNDVPEWQELINKKSMNYAFCNSLTEWLGGEGWDKVPEDIRELIYSFGIERTFGIDMDKARHAFCLLCDYDQYYLSFLELKAEIDKIKKMEIVAGLLPEAFRAGIIWREKYFQEKGK